MLNKMASVVYWAGTGMAGTSVVVGVVLAVLYRTWNPIVAWTILAAMIWGTARMLRYILSGK